jgi:ATP-dependent RNA helicase DeaD
MLLKEIKMAETFHDLQLEPSLIAALEKEGITRPTEIQLKVIPEVAKNKDLLVQSETGTGKTLAYLLPLFAKLNPHNREMQAMVLVPTHELAVQVQRQIEQLSQNSEIKLTAAIVIGNVNIARQIEKLREKPHIIVGSAGRILELIQKKKITAHTIKTIVLDEGDRLLEESNLANVKTVIKSTLKERQLMLFSATISREAIAKAKELMKEPEVLQSNVRATVPTSIKHVYFVAEQRDKIEVLRKLAHHIHPPKAIVFVNRTEENELISSKLQHHGLNAESIHGANIKLDRKKTMEEFRAGKLQLLIASDIAARGLHIEGVTHIFNLDLPEDPQDYLHRAGRTGRNGIEGTAVSIVTERELPLLKKYEKELNISFSEKDMYKGNIVDPGKGRR